MLRARTDAPGPARQNGTSLNPFNATAARPSATTLRNASAKLTPARRPALAAPAHTPPNHVPARSSRNATGLHATTKPLLDVRTATATTKPRAEYARSAGRQTTHNAAGPSSRTRSSSPTGPQRGHPSFKRTTQSPSYESIPSTVEKPPSSYMRY
ncbi:hypothetical protein EXIGLDRAFT_736390 [Exidia glandulosa HHB12029]|uniref:Uncharacterized protein n=1 Tax=Exidia glandulosa HHB12029 TaxID=1314781 RepID=A0A165JGA1_EXIGL|nr:hypothetical protein EXIGLDRAFT_736390 [Exidia glandulosa HHB12029]